MGNVQNMIFPRPDFKYDDRTFQGLPVTYFWIPANEPNFLSSADLLANVNPNYYSISPQFPKNHIPCLLIRKSQSKQLIIYSHANAVNMGQVAPSLMQSVSDWNASVLIYEYPGYGPAPGEPSMNTINASLRTVFSFARHALKWPADQIILFGRSIGSGPTCRIARELSDKKEQIGGVILLSPFINLVEVAAFWNVPRFVASGALPDSWDNARELLHVRAPLLLLHGLTDDVIPVRSIHPSITKLCHR